MLEWFRANSTAIQAMAAFLSFFLTVVLIAITWRYVRLTRDIAETTHRQLSAALQPVLELTIQLRSYGAGTAMGNLTYSATLGFSIINKGTSPVKLKHV